MPGDLGKLGELTPTPLELNPSGAEDRNMCAEQARKKSPMTGKAKRRLTPLADELAAGAVLLHSVGASTDYEIFVAELCAKPAAGELGAFANNVHVALLSHAWLTGKKSAIFSFVLHASQTVCNIVIYTSEAAAEDPRLKDTQLTLEIVGTMLKRTKGPVTTYVVEPRLDTAFGDKVDPRDEPLKISQITADTVIAGLATFYGLG